MKNRKITASWGFNLSPLTDASFSQFFILFAQCFNNYTTVEVLPSTITWLKNRWKMFRFEREDEVYLKRRKMQVHPCVLEILLSSVEAIYFRKSSFLTREISYYRSVIVRYECHVLFHPPTVIKTITNLQRNNKEVKWCRMHIKNLKRTIKIVPVKKTSLWSWLQLSFIMYKIVTP